MKRSANGKVVSCCKGTNSLLYAVIFVVLFSSCSVSRQISRQATAILLQDSAIANGHIGISIYEPGENRYLYNYNADKYFIPASNTKFFTLYAGMKYLGDSLEGIYYQNYSSTQINLIPTGDPTFLHPGFPNQPVISFLQKANKWLYISNPFAESTLGKGWAWDDYNESYMVEKNALPVFGNVVKFKLNKIKYTSPYSGDLDWDVQPALFKDSIASQYILPYKVRAMRMMLDTILSRQALYNFSITRNQAGNEFFYDKNSPADVISGRSDFIQQVIPFNVNGISTAKKILAKEFGLRIKDTLMSNADDLYSTIPPNLALHCIKSQPTDSLFKPMMHNSDNFFAEQTLLMTVLKFNHMKTEEVIEYLLKSDFSDIPQQPRWVDGSGLSRYNLFTPRSFIYILNKLQQDFGMKRLQVILPTGGQGTLKNYFNSDSNFIYAKTGSMSNQFSLCGYLTTKKNRQLIFSVLVNNEMSNARDVRRAVERFIKIIRNKY